MPLSGIKNQEEQDFPRTVRESVTTLPYFTGGETQLAVTDVPDDLVLVSALRRFENRTRVAEGTHTGAADQAVLTDSTADFVNWGVEVGDLVRNVTDGSQATITVVTATTITGVLAGGAEDDWDAADVYQIDKATSHASARAEEVRKVRIITDLDCYIAFDGEASSANHLVRLNAGESLNEADVRIVSRISFINVTATQRPVLRWFVFGV